MLSALARDSMLPSPLPIIEGVRIPLGSNSGVIFTEEPSGFDVPPRSSKMLCKSCLEADLLIPSSTLAPIFLVSSLTALITDSFFLLQAQLFQRLDRVGGLFTSLWLSSGYLGERKRQLVPRYYPHEVNLDLNITPSTACKSPHRQHSTLGIEFSIF